MPDLERSNNFVYGGLTHYAETRRIKIVRFEEPSSTSDVMAEFERGLVAVTAEDPNSSPDHLIQVRFLAHAEEAQALDRALNEQFSTPEFSRAGVVGRIPFNHSQGPMALYYAHLEPAGRKSYPYPKTPIDCHERAVQVGMEKRRRLENRPMPHDFIIEAVNYPTDQVWRFNGDRPEPTPKPFYSEEELEHQIIQMHTRSFAYAHDNSQREHNGVYRILDHNLTLLCYRPSTRELAALTYFEVDQRFTFGNIALVEPTYFTDPTFRSQGLSVHMRLATQNLVNQSEQVAIYNHQPIIIMNESIRYTSFPLCLQVGCELGGDVSTTLNGDLGPSYTYIGPANPQTGLMAMGLTYFLDPRITSL